MPAAERLAQLKARVLLKVGHHVICCDAATDMVTEDVVRNVSLGDCPKGSNCSEGGRTAPTANKNVMFGDVTNCSNGGRTAPPVKRRHRKTRFPYGNV